MDNDIFSRRFGPKFEKPCKNQGTIGCALYKCQAANECQSGVEKSPPAPIENTTDESAEKALFDFLCRKWIPRSDERQKSMGLQYTLAETHDLAKELSRFFEIICQTRIATAVKAARVEALREAQTWLEKRVEQMADSNSWTEKGREYTRDFNRGIEPILEDFNALITNEQS